MNKLKKVSSNYYQLIIDTIEITLSKVDTWQLVVIDYSLSDDNCILYSDYFNTKKEALNKLKKLKNL